MSAKNRQEIGCADAAPRKAVHTRSMWALPRAVACCMLIGASALASPPVELSDVAAGTGGFVINGIDAGDNLGWDVSGAGDVNGDGLADIIIGAGSSDPELDSGAGESYVVFGKTSGAAVNLSAVASGTGGFVINEIDVDDLSGRDVSGAGDVNGDGKDDLIVGARWADPGGNSRAGESYVIFGKASTGAVDLSAIVAGTGGFIINGIDTDDNSGFSVSGAGDVNGDGKDDLIIGAPQGDLDGDLHEGESYVVFGKSSTTAVNLSSVATGTGGFVINGITLGDVAGYSVSGAGDVNGDGRDDLVIGAPSVDFFSIGESYVVFGKTSTSAIDLSDVSAGTGGFVIKGIDRFDQSGFSVSGAGDVNGDGLSDAIIGVRLADPDGVSAAGESYVVFGKASTTAVNLSEVAAGTGGFIIKGVAAGDQSGFSVSGAGDVNGDGLDDVVIGARFADTNSANGAGESYVVYGKSSTSVVDLADVAAGTGGFVISGADFGDQSGRSVSGAGDVNGDGLSDVIVGASLADPGGQIGAGESYVVFAPALTPSATVWVDFAFSGVQNGSQSNPYDNILVGIAKVSNGGTINFAAGTTSRTLTLSKSMTLQANGGTVRIGVPPARVADASTGQSGFLTRSSLKD